MGVIGWCAQQGDYRCRPKNENEAMDRDILTPVSVMDQHEHYGRLFPLVLQCRSRDVSRASMTQSITARRQQLGQQAAQYGVVLFRGLPLRGAEDFDAFIEAFGYRSFPYDESLSNAVRLKRTQRVFTANEAPPDVVIQLHHEMAQTPIFPSKLFFFCEQPAERRGATSMMRSDVFWERLLKECPDFARDCEEKGLIYSHIMPAESDLKSGMGRSWQSTLGAGSRDAAEERLRQLKYTWQWQADGLRVTTPVLPAVRQLSSGRKSFFNQLLAASQGWKDSRNDPENAIRFGDGSRLDRAAVLRAADMAEELTFDLVWQRGDVALVDNFVVMHGRRAYQGTRKVLASLVPTDE